MTYIERDKKIYKQTILEEEINVDQEEYKLQSWKDALVNDAREINEYKAKLEDIDTLSVDEKYKDLLKLQVTLSSPSGITQKMVDVQQEIVDNLRNI